MKVRLIRPARILHHPGEVVEISPDEARFLLGIGSAEIVQTKMTYETPEAPKSPVTTKPTTTRKVAKR